jgi:hypothetical protein
VALLALLFACHKTEAPAPGEHPPMGEAEKRRAGEICDGYVARVCACAEKDPSLGDACALARGQPEAVRMHLDVLHGAPLAQVGPGGELLDAGARRGPLNENERRLTEASLRKVVAACVKLDAELDPDRCPRRKP